MSQHSFSPFQRLARAIASSRPGIWFFSRNLHHFDSFFLKISGGRVTLSSLTTGAPILMLTSIGAKSGLPRTFPLMYISEPSGTDCFALIASNWGRPANPAWYYNLKKNPRAEVKIKGKTRIYRARELHGEEYDRWWEVALRMYHGYANYRIMAGNRRIPILVLDPAKD